MLALNGNTVSHHFWKSRLVAVWREANAGSRFPKILVHRPQSNTVLFAYVLLTRCLRSSIVLVLCGISWSMGYWQSHWIRSDFPEAEDSAIKTHTTTCLLTDCWLNLGCYEGRPQNTLKPQPYQSWIIWAASQQNLQNDILQFSAETGSTRNVIVKCWITWTYADNWKSMSNNSRISLKGWFASLIKLLEIY